MVILMQKSFGKKTNSGNTNRTTCQTAQITNWIPLKKCYKFLAMANVNKVMLMGNITRDIDLRKTPGGTSVADIGLAVNRVRTDDQGQRIEETTFVDVTLWGRTAEVVHQYAGKGQPLFVEGRLHMDSWDDKTSGQKRTKLKVVAESIQLIGSKGGNSNSRPTQHEAQAATVDDINEIEPPF